MSKIEFLSLFIVQVKMWNPFAYFISNFKASETSCFLNEVMEVIFFQIKLTAQEEVALELRASQVCFIAFSLFP